jgi:hypothetical protein
VNELPLPGDAAISDSTEFLRAWLHGDRMEFVSLGNVFEDPGFIGIFAADVVRHLVGSSARSEADKSADLARAVAAFKAEF